MLNLSPSRPRSAAVAIAAGLLLTGCSVSDGGEVASPSSSTSPPTSETPTIESPAPEPTSTPAPSPTTEEENSMSTVVLTVADRTITAQLFDNPAAADLLTQLPVTLTFRDFNAVEKIAPLPAPLTMEGVPAGDDPQVNDLGYYNPSGDLVLYYGDVGYFNGIVRLGTFEPDDMAFLAGQPDGFEVTVATGD